MMLGVAFAGLSSLLSGASMLKMGMMAASAIGMFLLNGKKEKGEVGRLTDLKVSSSSYGRGISIVYGTMRVTGNLIWATDFEEEMKFLGPKGKDKKKSKGKGTPYFVYYANYAMAMCEGPVEEIIRIWADSNLIYDKLNPNNEDIVNIGFSRENGQGGGKSGFGAGKKKGNDGGDSGRFKFRWYSGTEDQMPDPFILSKQESWQVPAHRGLAYLFFERFKLEDFGNRIPTITAEVTVRKKQEVAYGLMSNIDNQQFFVPTANFKAIDVERYKLYFEEIQNGERVLRIYDLSRQQEVRRMYASDINRVNGWTNNPSSSTTTSFRRFVGLSGNGDIIVALTLGNSQKIGFLDPNTFVAKRLFGGYSSRLENTAVSIVYPTLAVPAAYIFVIPDPDEPKPETIRATIIQSLGGEYMVFDEKYEPITFFALPEGVVVNPKGIVPYKATIFGGEFGVWTEHNTGTAAYIYRILWGCDPFIFELVNGVPRWGFSLDAKYPVTAELLRSIETFNGSTVQILALQAMLNTEELFWLESIIDPTNPLTEGLYACTIDMNRFNEGTFETNVLDWRERISGNAQIGPSQVASWVNPLNVGGKYSWFNGGLVYNVDVLARDFTYFSAGNGFRQFNGNEGLSVNNYQWYWPQRGGIIRMISDPTDGNRRKWALALLDRQSQTPVNVHLIITDLADRVGIPAEKLDLSRLDNNEITGYILENPTSARRVVEELAQVFLFDVAEIDYRLHAVSRGIDHVAVVPQKHLVPVDTETNDYFSETRIQEIDLPQTVLVSYINAEKDYQTNSQHYRRPRSPMQTMQSRDKLEVNLPMAMEKTDAKRLAHKICMSLWTERITYQVNLPWEYLQYDPTDVLRFEMDDGLAWEARMMAMDVGADFSIEAAGVTQTPAAYVSQAEAQPDGGIIITPTLPDPLTEAYVGDIPYIEDRDSVADGQYVYYWGARASAAGFRAASMSYRIGNLNWTFGGVIDDELVWGFVPDVIPPPPHGPFATDDKTRIRLLPGRDYSDELGTIYNWEPVPHNEWPSTRNTIIIGNEIIYFRDAEIADTGEVFISHLIRGARGTEAAAYTHVPGEIFAVAGDGLGRGLLNLDTIGQLVSFRTTSQLSFLMPPSTSIVLTGASQKPYAPTDIKRTTNTSGNVTISWKRRTRFGGAGPRNLTDVVPLNEEEQKFELFILSGPYDPNFFNPDNPSTWKRRFFNISGTSLVYNTTNQATDGVPASGPIHVVIYQISTSVGRGFPGYATLYPSILIEA